MEKIAIKKNQSAFLKHLISFLKRYHLLLFFVFVAACLSFGVIIINTIVNSEGGTAETVQQTPSATIDQETVQHIESLHTSAEPTGTPSLPSGRINPFAE